MIKTGITILMLLYCTLCRGQCDSIRESSVHNFDLMLSYNSSLIYPGMSIGIEFPIINDNAQVIKIKKNVRNFTKKRFISGNLNWYHHPYFHDNLYLTTEWVMRRIRYTGFISEFSAGAGYSRTFLGGTTYKVDDKGNISIVRLSGYNYALITAGGGFGHDFSMKTQLPLSAIAKMNLIIMFPYNSTIYFRPVLEFGIRYTPGKAGNRLKMESNTISKYK
jgi:hypothetical protein